MNSPLQSAYEAYLRCAFGPRESEALANELEVAGLLFEAGALRHYLSRRQDGYVVPIGPWQDCSCEVGPTLPSNPQEGELWFDTVEVTPMVFVRELPDVSPDVRGWMAIRPVQVWQFLTFLAVAEPIRRHADDWLDRERFDKMRPLNPVVDLCGDEANAYCLWFGKYTLGWYGLMCAEKILTRERKEMISPRSLFLCGCKSGNSAIFDVAAFEESTGQLVEDEMDEGDTDPTVGVATHVCMRDGLVEPADLREHFKTAITRSVIK